MNLPFQIIETVNESRATREVKRNKQQSFFDIWEGDKGETFETGWKNKIIWGDNLLVMGSLLDNFSGKFDLIYIDPPFATGADFSLTNQIGDEKDKVYKKQSAIEEKAYRDTWGKGDVSFIAMIYERLKLIRELLSENGSLYVHCDWRMTPMIRLSLDEIFGNRNYLNECIWYYKTGGLPEKLGFGKKHDTIHFVTKNRDYAIWNLQKEKSYLSHNYGFSNIELFKDKQGTYSLVNLRDVWDISALRGNQPERVDYPTQKPEALLERIICASTNEGSLVGDFFCGSGTTLSVAEKFGRRWIGCDLGRWSIHVTRKRLLGIENCKPFEVMNLGKYERQHWQGVTFDNSESKTNVERKLYSYLAFILQLFGAKPIEGFNYLHGKKEDTMVHIGAVDTPITIDEINSSIEECIRLNQNKLTVLGWEWEMGLYDLVVDFAKKKGVKLMLQQIPNEVMEKQAAEKGEVTFFELAYLEATVENIGDLSVEVKLKDFVIPNVELIPEQVRKYIKRWSDYIDYWAIDWNFNEDSFVQGWVNYRTRRNRKLELVSDTHKYELPGNYNLLVKVVDVFGNDTSQLFNIEV